MRAKGRKEGGRIRTGECGRYSKVCQRISFLTCESVSTFVRQVPDSINDCIFSGIGI